MKQIPILFSTPMVAAILDGNKTMTRRIVKPQPNFDTARNAISSDKSHKVWSEGQIAISDEDFVQGLLGVKINNSFGYVQPNIKCPYGQVGDVLWVKEAFYAYGWWRKNGLTKSGKLKWLFNDVTLNNHGYYLFLDYPPQSVQKGHSAAIGWYKRSSLFMPKVAARIFVKNTNIKVERAKDISEADAMAEGIQPLLMSRAQLNSYGQLYRDYSLSVELFNEGCRSIQSFKSLWQKINGAESWDANPFVWVIEFERCEKPTT